jgi:hypothetical protein
VHGRDNKKKKDLSFASVIRIVISVCAWQAQHEQKRSNNKGMKQKRMIVYVSKGDFVQCWSEYKHCFEWT